MKLCESARGICWLKKIIIDPPVIRLPKARDFSALTHNSYIFKLKVGIRRKGKENEGKEGGKKGATNKTGQH